jgi:hypothetical protein
MTIIPWKLVHRGRWIFFAITILIITAGLYFPVTEKYTQSFRFVDEEEHITVGALMTQGYRLYKDISPNHQPLNYILSELVQKTAHPDNVFMLLKRHREALWVWSIIWIFILSYRFHWGILPFVLGFEATKYFILGNEFLAESLAVYPLAYLAGAVFEQLLTNNTWREDFGLGLAGLIVTLLVIYLAPVVGVLLAIRLILRRGKGVIPMVAGGLTMIVFCFSLIDIPGYFRDTIINNYKYQVPELNPIKSSTQILQLLLFPLQVFTLQGSLLTQWIAWAVIGLFGSLIYLAIKHQIKWWVVVGVYGLLVLINTRQLTPFPYFYQGFHLLPWMGVLFLLMGIALTRVHNRLSSVLITLPAIILTLNQGMPYWIKIDPFTENYVQYTPVVQAAQVVNSLKNPDDDLMVMPINSIVHWLTQIPPSTRQITFYHWQYAVPEQRQNYLKVMSSNPPAFIVYTNDNSAYSKGMEQYLSDQYTLIFEEKEQMQVYMLKTRLAQVTARQWQSYFNLPMTGKTLEDMLSSKQKI